MPYSRAWVSHTKEGAPLPPIINFSKPGSIQAHLIQLKRRLTILRGIETDLHSTLCHHLIELMMSTRKIALCENHYLKGKEAAAGECIDLFEDDQLGSGDVDDVLSRGRDPFIDDLFDISEVMRATADGSNLPKSFILQAWMGSLSDEKRPDISVSVDAKTVSLFIITSFLLANIYASLIEL